MKKIKIISEIPQSNGEITVNLLIDGKKKYWRMAKGLWGIIGFFIISMEYPKMQP